MTSDEAVEAAAKALRERFYGYEIELPWDSHDQQTTCRNDAQAALEAAAPYLLAPLDAVKGLHRKAGWVPGNPRPADALEHGVCEYCGVTYPCQTIEAIESAGTD